MLAMVDERFEQIELFPRASAAEIEKAKELLDEYEQSIRLRSVLEEESIEELSETERASYRKVVAKIKRIERAVKLILDEEVRGIIEFRYINGNTYTTTVHHYTKMMDDRTVDRKLNKGIESVAESLKLFEK